MVHETLTQADNGESIEVKTGDLITIRLDENPTTGYRWTVDKANQDVVTLTSSDYTPAPSTGIGGGGERTFTFKAVKAGVTPIQLKLYRDWKGDSSIIQRFEITFQIQN